ncbi:MAG TPA: hypothetical protein VK723_03640, partial [Thermoplasmata archaeon]|nr:hypothetical protein [Thermoplasmata archaeon]
GIPPIIAAFVIAGVVLAIGWTCPSGGTGFCSHAYIAGGWLLVLVIGGALFMLGLILFAVGGKRPAS